MTTEPITPVVVISQEQESITPIMSALKNNHIHYHIISFIDLIGTKITEADPNKHIYTVAILSEDIINHQSINLNALWKNYPHLYIILLSTQTDHQLKKLISESDYHHQLFIIKKPFETIELIQLIHKLTLESKKEYELNNKISILKHTIQEKKDAFEKKLYLLNQETDQNNTLSQKIEQLKHNLSTIKNQQLNSEESIKLTQESIIKNHKYIVDTLYKRTEIYLHELLWLSQQLAQNTFTNSEQENYANTLYSASTDLFNTLYEKKFPNNQNHKNNVLSN